MFTIDRMKMTSMLDDLDVRGKDREDILAGRKSLSVKVSLVRANAGADDPEAQAADNAIRIMGHVRAGRIPRRPGESVEDFGKRLARGDFEDPDKRKPDFGDAVLAARRGQPMPEGYEAPVVEDDGFADRVVDAMRAQRSSFCAPPPARPATQLRPGQDFGDSVIEVLKRDDGAPQDPAFAAKVAAARKANKAQNAWGEV